MRKYEHLLEGIRRSKDIIENDIFNGGYIDSINAYEMGYHMSMIRRDIITSYYHFNDITSNQYKLLTKWADKYSNYIMECLSINM